MRDKETWQLRRPRPETSTKYYSVQHYKKEDEKVKWCYIGSKSKLPEKYRLKINEDQTIHNYTQQNTNYTQLYTTKH